MGGVCCKGHYGERGELIVLYRNLNTENKIRKLAAYEFDEPLTDADYFELYDDIVLCSN